MAMLQVLQECNLWKDFPNGLQVLVVDKDTRVLTDIKAKLEECKYIVTAFDRSEDALMALEDPKNSFHIALVEAATGGGLDGFSILIARTKNNIPMIMMSDTENKDVMLRAFALGAVEFLLKPLADEKLKNVWQHAVRKAFSVGEQTVRPESLEFLETAIESPVNSPSVSHSDQDILENSKEDAVLTIEGYPDLDGHVIIGCEKISAPSTPQQLILKPREENNEVSSGSETQSNQATEIVSTEFSGSSNSSVDEVKKGMEGFNTELQTSLDSANGDALCTALDFDCCDKMELGSANFDDLCLSDGDLLSDIDIDPQIFADFSLQDHGDLDLYNLDNCELLEKDLAEEEALLLAEVSKAEKEQLNANIPDITNYDLSKSSDFNMKEEALSDNKKSSRSESLKIASKNAQGKRKVKVDWTPDLHRRFVQAVEQLGVEKAVPSRILELMGVNCLTRHNIASHLQKYRSHRKHLLAREVEAASWSQRRQLYATTAGTRPRRELTPWLTNGGSSLIQPRPPISYQPMQSAAHAPPFRPLHVWGHPTLDHSMVHMWQKQPFPATPAAWPAGDGSLWQHQPPGCADTWTHNTPAPGTPCYPQPLLRLRLAPVPGVPHYNPPVFNGDHYRPREDSNPAIHPVNIDVPAQLKPATLHPSKETVDAAIDEVLSNPWAPLPIGLKPPLLESVITELQKQGISVVPPASTCLALC